MGTTSVHGRARWLDNMFIESLWWSVKYECIYLHAFETGSELQAELAGWIAHYNGPRPYTALAGRTPDEACHDTLTPSEGRQPTLFLKLLETLAPDLFSF